MNDSTSYRRLILWIGGLLGTAYIVGWITRSNLVPWYETLPKSSLTPPDIFFSVVWTVLYIMMAIVGWLLWEVIRQKRLKVLFTCQLFINWAWTPVFFQYHWVGMACLIILALLAFVGWVMKDMFFLARKDPALKKHALVGVALLVPYFIWSLFALYLNGYIWWYS